MPKYDIDPMPPQISAEVIALLEQTETATVGHWRHWGFCDRRIQPLLRRKRVAGTAVTLAIPGPEFDPAASRAWSAAAGRHSGGGSARR